MKKSEQLRTKVLTMGYLPNGEFAQHGYIEVPVKQTVEIGGYTAHVHRPVGGAPDTWFVSISGQRVHYEGASTIKAAIQQAREQVAKHASIMAEAVAKADVLLASAVLVTLERP